MKQRTTNPDRVNKYYLKSPAGYNPCILGNSNHRLYPNSVLVNCVGCAVGRFNEILNEDRCAYLGNTNAENFYALAKAQGLEVGKEPREGGVMVWAKGKVGVSSDGAGHVACVEQVYSDGRVKTFESGWGYTSAYTSVNNRSKGDGNWGMSGYTYLGCIYNPGIDPYKAPSGTLKIGSSGEGVKWLQWALVKQGLSITVDGVFGKVTQSALRTFQSRQGLFVDGIAGPDTQKRIKELYTLEA